MISTTLLPQASEVSVFRPFKIYCAPEQDTGLHNNLERIITIYDYQKLLPIHLRLLRQV